MPAEMSDASSTRPAPRGFTGRDMPSEAIFNTCIKCGLCLPTCPTYVLTQDERSSPRGRINLIGEVLSGALPIEDRTFRAQMSECLGCRNCEPVCPSGVAFGALLENARAQIARDDERKLSGGLLRLAYDFALASPKRLRLMGTLLRWYQASGVARVLRNSGALDALGVGRWERLLPDLADEPFVADGSVCPAEAGPIKGRAALFAGCVMCIALPAVHRATVRVLTKNGWAVEVPAGQGCCGALHVHAGFKDRGRELARRTIQVFERSQAERVVVNAAGCGAVMKEYGHLLAGDPDWADRAEAFAARVCDVTELLAEHPLNTEAMAPVQARVTYQDPCHLVHAQRVRLQPRLLIDAVPGVARAEMPEADRCCGSAGTYNLTHPKMAEALLERKLDAAESVSAQRIITANPGCYLQLAAGARRRRNLQVQHVVELLDESYRASSNVTHAT